MCHKCLYESTEYSTDLPDLPLLLKDTSDFNELTVPLENFNVTGWK